MGIRLYETEPYISSFTASIDEIRGEWISLDHTAFFPGGGGQEPDIGAINGLRVVQVKQEKGTVLHQVPGHKFTAGEQVEGKIDWARRYDLMMGHSAEHLLFSCLIKLSPEIELVKISITPEKKSVMLRGNIDWDIVAEAQRMALDAVTAKLAITEAVVDKDDPLLLSTRVKMERIHGEKVRVVMIGDIDQAACAGIHVKNTEELGMVLITKFVSARPTADYEVEFEVGDKAKHSSLVLSTLALKAAEKVGSRPADLGNALTNLLSDRERMEAALSRYAAKEIRDLIPSEIDGIPLYAGSFQDVDKKVLMDAASELISTMSACVLMAVGERLMLVIACHPDLKVDCVKILNQALSPVGGRGGGRPNFATGGALSSEKADDIMVSAITSMRAALGSR